MSKLKSLVVSTLMLSLSSVQALEVHEWGTFTSLVNENGIPMNGMQHEEVGLPGFVYGLRADGVSNLKSGNPRCLVSDRKCAFDEVDVLPYNAFNTVVTQKMETPVIYFYGNKGEKAQVNVQFPNGMISQWYPAASDLNLHLNEFKQGHMTWNVTLKDVNGSFPATQKNSIWNPARATNANAIVTDNGEQERFIFYRGLAEFNVPLKIQTRKSKGLILITVTNNSPDTLPAMFYIQSEKQAGIQRFMAFPSLKSQESITFAKDDMTYASTEAKLEQALIATGLFKDEAVAMLKTWNESYFHTTGERLLYILPSAWTENILPLKVTPTPSKLVRVLVGRVELFHQDAQAELISRLDQKGLTIEKDHLLEAKLNAAKGLSAHNVKIERVLNKINQ